jgi:hypothetical protein
MYIAAETEIMKSSLGIFTAVAEIAESKRVC